MNRLVILELLLAIIVSFKVAFTHSACPCSDAPIEHEHYSNQRILNFSNDTLVLCVSESQAAVKMILSSLRLTNITVHFLESKSDIQGECNVLLKVVHTDKTNALSPHRRQLCPGVCRPVPEIQIPHTWFGPEFSEVIKNDSLLTCTLTSSMVRNDYPGVSGDRTKGIKGSFGKLDGKSSTNSIPGTFLRALFWRRIMECYEKKFWQSRYSEQSNPPFVNTLSADSTSMRNEKEKKRRKLFKYSKHKKRDELKIKDGENSENNQQKQHNQPLNSIPARPVLTAIIWTGSRSNIGLIEAQASMLSGQAMGGTDAVLGWASTDEQYPCRSTAIRCGKGGLSRYKYLPQTAINFMSPGWSCAQRRPLRSLAHILILLDPKYVIVLDDDTYLNYNLLVQKYGEYLTTGAMSKKSLVVGELGGSWGDTGQLSKHGIFNGGAGYVLSRKTIEALKASEVKYFQGQGQWSKERNIKDSDTYRSNKQIFSLSVYREGMEHNASYCDKSKPCVLSAVPHISTVTANNSYAILIAVPLIEFCANLMANEHTCHHSDHSMGRCLVYGAFADPVSTACHSTAPEGNPMLDPFYPGEPVKLGFCFMTPQCNTSNMVTCHRYKPDPRTYAPVRVLTQSGYYKVHSSSFNGSLIDNHT